ncbi:hypothetical protein QBC39DRAFT_401019 [Podospora conica]|nr:hypothetical protein QBC39DRAFT_401019 [Schizothecium conicum]
MARLHLFSLLVTVGAVLADNCDVKPLVAKIRNVTYEGGRGENRGVAVTIGDQVLGLRLSTVLSNTRLRNPFDCVDVRNVVACTGQAGGIYDPTEDTFERAHTPEEWDVLTIDAGPTDGTTILQGYDNLTFDDAHVSLPRLPIEVWANSNRQNRSALGLGRASSLLHRLLAANLIPALPFSLDFGSRSELYPRNGQLILGGYNAARHHPASGAARFNLSAFSAPAPCPLQVLLSDVILTDHVTGVATSLFDDPNLRLPACVDPLQNAFAFTPAMFAKWQRLTGWIPYDGSNYSAQLYPKRQEDRMGTLTIKLAGGYESVIPHYELLSHERGNGTDGVYTVLNTSRVMAAVTGGWTDLGENVPVLGGVFLSRNYLVVDYPGNEFWLSPMGEEAGEDVKSFCQEGSGGGGAGLGVKVGVPVGVGVGVLVVAAGLWYFWYHRPKTTTPARPAGGRPEEDVPLDTWPTEHTGTRELPGERVVAPRELNGEVERELPGGRLETELNAEVER